AIAIEQSETRAQRISKNAQTIGVERLQVINGSAPECLDGLAKPDCVFVGGGLSEDMLQYLTGKLSKGTRIVCNAVTLESEALLAKMSRSLGGELLRIELSHAGALGKKHGWKAAYPVVQWGLTL
ncbi:MAG: cobalamin biosynthesis bifunctional protein CbiET, partial [Marinovum sp.]|nr:cobalamin biosynthesis bifunctional protein CbiET [Marinovum sp.]